MRTYYETPPQTGLVVQANKSKVFTIPHPTRVRLINIRVLQTGGTLATFTIDLFEKSVPDSPSANNADDFWLVTPRGGVASSAAGTLVYDFSDFDKYFQNADTPIYVQAQGQNSPSLVSIISAKRKIYLRITNAGGTDNTYMVSIGSEFLGD